MLLPQVSQAWQGLQIHWLRCVEGLLDGLLDGAPWLGASFLEQGAHPSESSPRCIRKTPEAWIANHHGEVLEDAIGGCGIVLHI